MGFRCGIAAKTILVPLLLALVATAAAPSSFETVWREARMALDRGDTARATALTDEALKRAGASQEKAVWELRVFRAQLHAGSAQYSEAAKLLADFPSRLARTDTGARRLVVQARLSVAAQNDNEARAFLEQARAIALNDAPAAAPEILVKTGQNSVADLKEALRLSRKHGDDVNGLKAEVQLLYHSGNQGLLAEGIQTGERAQPRIKKLGLVTLGATLSGNLGWLYAEVGDYDRAAELLSAGLAEATRVGRREEQVQWSVTLCDKVHLARRDWNAAVRSCQSAIDATQKQGHQSLPDAFVGLARAYLETGRLAEARTMIRTARELEKDEKELLARVVEARIDLADRQYDAAERQLRAVLDAAKNARTQLLAHGQLAHLYALTSKNDLAEKEFERAIALVREARKTVTSRELRLFFFNTTSELYDNYVDFYARIGRDEDALRVTETIRAQTLAEERDVAAPQKLDARKIAQQRNAVILSYWLGRRNSYVWTITPAGVKLTRLNKTDFEIEKAVEPYQKQLVTTAGTLERSGTAGRNLYNLLVAPAAANIPRGSNVIVVADGKLHMLNFETLVVPGPQPRYWIEDVVLSSASSLQLLARGMSRSGAAPKMLIVGNPPSADPAFPPLKKAGDEIQRIEKQFAGRTKTLAGPNATPAGYAAAKPESFDFVHFVAHGVPVPTRPLDSAVILGQDKDGDYRLMARAIADRPLHARLVTISSCYGAGAATYSGEGLVGLAWAFRYAGADQVIAALWAVNDTAAPKLMEEMYAGIRAGKEPAVALRDAKLRLLTSRTAHKQPMFWAPFVVYL